MNYKDFTIINDEIIVESNYSKYVLDYNSLKKSDKDLINTVYYILLTDNIKLEYVTLWRRNYNYISIVYKPYFEFLRLGEDKKYNWFSLYMSPKMREKYRSDKRFITQNRQHNYWRIRYSMPDELYDYAELICEACQAMLKDVL